MSAVAPLREGSSTAPEPEARQTVISIEKLVKRFGTFAAVDGIDLSIYRGECVGLLGPNGAGKTTTLEILEGLQEPTSGSVRLLGKSWSTSRNELREKVG